MEENEATVTRRAEIVGKMDAFLKPGGNASLYHDSHRIDGINARGRVDWQERQVTSRETSPRKDYLEEQSQGAVGP